MDEEPKRISKLIANGEYLIDVELLDNIISYRLIGKNRTVPFIAFFSSAESMIEILKESLSTLEQLQEERETG